MTIGPHDAAAVIHSESEALNVSERYQFESHVLDWPGSPWQHDDDHDDVQAP
jgi:hypothetical protein